MTLAEVEREYILKVYAECKENLMVATEILGIGRATLYRKLGQYGINRNGKHRALESKQEVYTPASE